MWLAGRAGSLSPSCGVLSHERWSTNDGASETTSVSYGVCGNLLVPLIVSHSYEGEATVRETSEIITRDLHPSQQVMSDNGRANNSRNLHIP